MSILFDFQKEDVNKVCDILAANNRAAIFSTVGTGKSLIALEVSKRIAKLNTLIICPSFLRNNWALEIKKHYSQDAIIYPKQPNPKCNYYIINYENLAKIKDLSYFDCLIIDETQYIKNHKTIRAKQAWKIINTIKYTILLTGTPISKGIVDFYMYAKILSKSYAKMDYWTFCNRYSNMVKKRLGSRVITDFQGIKQETLPEIRAIQSKYTIRRKSEDVIKLPSKQEIEMRVEVKPIKVDAENTFMAFKDYMEHQRINEHLMAYKRENAILKATATYEYVNSMSEPVLIFSDHPEAVKRISEGLELASGIITGDTHPLKRQDIVNDFEAGKINIIVASIGALSEGVSLPRATKVIYNDFNYSPIKMVQSKARVRRINSQHAAQCAYIVSSDLDSRILSIIKSKQDDIAKVIQ